MNSLRATCQLSAVLLLLVFANVAAVQAEPADKKGGVIKGLVDWLFDKPAAEAVAVEAFAAPMAANPVVAESDLKSREARLIAWSAAMQDWMSRVAKLSDEQQETLKTIGSKSVELAKVGREIVLNGRVNQQGVSDHIPIKFTAAKGRSSKVDLTTDLTKLVFVKLTDQQKTKLEAAAKERKQFHRDANVGYILNLLDADLCLTQKQRDEAAKAIRASVDLNGACYSFQPYNYYFQQTSIANLLNHNELRQQLSDSQKLRSGDMGNQNRRYTSFSSNEGMEAWQDKLADDGDQQKKRLRHAADVRVDFHATSAELDKNETHYLRVASRGAIEDVIKAWKVTARQQLDSWEDRAAQFGGQNVSFSVSGVDVKQFETNELWKSTVTSLTEGKTIYIEKRDKTRSEAWARFVVAMIDKELWLSTAQRKEMIARVADVMPPPDYEVQNAMYWREVGLLVIPLFKLSSRDLAFLTAGQKEAWTQLKKPFQLQGNYVVLQMQNGGSMHLTLPQ